MKKPLLFIHGFATVLLLLLSYNGFSQTMEVCICDKNNQDKTLEIVYLGDSDGNMLPSDYQCNEGENQKVYLWAKFQGNATRYSLYVQFNLLIDDVLDRSYGQCFFFKQPIPTGVPVLIDSIYWSCGAEVKLADYFMSWQANDNSDNCGCTYQGCYGSPVEIIVKAPLVAKMSYTSSCTSGDVAETFVFNDASSGGNFYQIGEPYSYLWDFGPDTGYDILDGTLTSSPVTVKWLSSGEKIVSLTVTDSTMISRTKTATITVDACFHLTAEAQPGTFECSDEAGINGWLDSAGGATTAGAHGEVTWSYASYTLAGGCASYTGSATVVFTATDEAMNTVTTSALLTVKDTTSPEITMDAEDETVECDGNGNTGAYDEWLENHGWAEASDNCDTELIWSYTEGIWETLCGNSKKISVTFEATDDCGNVSTETLAVFTIEDTSAPVISKKAENTIVKCDGTGNVSEYMAWLAAHASAEATDVCGGTVTWTYEEGTWSDGCGLTKSVSVTFYAADACNNKSSGTSAVFTIEDTTDPAFACPQNITEPADEGKNYGTVTIGVPVVNEACGLVTLVNDYNDKTDASDEYPLGKTTVTYTATDECGNIATCSFTVTILDEEAPGLTCPGDISNISCIGNLPAPYADYGAFVDDGGSAQDNQGIDVNSFALVSSVSNGQSCPEIITRIYSIEDTDGNLATCTQTITVDDKTDPYFTEIPENMSVECDGEGNTDDLEEWLDSVAASDNCGIVTVTNNYGDGAEFTDGCGNTGSVTVTWTAMDACGNSASTSAVFSIVDTTPPDFVTPADVTIKSDEFCDFDASPETTGYPTGISDMCSGTMTPTVEVEYNDVLSKGSEPGVQIITRTWSVIDPCGNKKSKVQVITVLGGNAPPDLVLHEICVYLTKYGKWTLNSDDIRQMTKGTSANCGATTDLMFDISPISFDCNDVFVKVPVKVIATDYQGNTASGTTYVIVKDTISPVAVCQDNTLYLDRFGQAFLYPSMVNPGTDYETAPEWAVYYNKLQGGSYDNCGISEMFLSRQLYTCADLGGPKQVTLSVVDPSGNNGTCKAMVTVLDTIKPVIVPVANVTMTVAPGICTTKITYPDIVVRDNCGVIMEKLAGLGPDGMFPLGTTTETWKVSNIGGASAQTSFTVTISTYNGAPSIADITDVVVYEDAAKFEIPLSGIGYGVDCVAQQILSLEAANSNTALIKVEKEYVNGQATGKLWITPLANRNGEAVVTLTVKDNGGTANGGVDTTVKTFKVTVTPVNDAPVVTPVPDQFVTLPNSLSVNLGAAFNDVDEGDILTHVVALANGSPLPVWMNFNPSTGMLTGTPSAANLGVVEVKVVATDKAGATAQDNFLVVVLDPNATVINGTVVKGTTPLTGGIRVVLFEKDGTMFKAVANTTITAAGKFSFYNLPNGTYLVKAEITDAALNPGLMHTYYESSATVTQATHLAVTAPGTKNITITMVPSTLTEGLFKITGKVVRKTGTPDLITQGKDPVSTPAPGIDMVLKINGMVVDNTVTGTDGTYAFTDLPEGEYEVRVELPGYTQEVTRMVTVNAANPLRDKVDFTIWTAEGTHIITNISELSGGFAMQLYPNPTTGKVNIDILWNEIREVEVSVFTIRGAEVYRKAFHSGEKIVFDLSKNASGMYMVKIDIGSHTQIDKLIIDKK